MFKRNSPIELLAAGPSDTAHGELRGFLWHIDEAKRNQAYMLEVRIGLLPASDVDRLEDVYRPWAE